MKLFSTLVYCFSGLAFLFVVSGDAKAQQLGEAFTIPTADSTLILFELNLSSADEPTEALLFDESGETTTVSLNAFSSNLPFATAELPSDRIGLPVFGLVFGTSSGGLIAVVAVDPPIQITHDDLTQNEQDRLLDLCTPTYENYGGNDFKKYKNRTNPKLPAGGDYQEIYCTGPDDPTRFVYDWNTGKMFLNREHYEGPWYEITNPWWIPGSGPLFPPPQ